MNKTLEKFGHPTTLVKDFGHWCILMRPAQVTLGALILGSKHEATSLGTLPQAAYAELQVCTAQIEKALRQFNPYDKINYLALMMVDPHVHFHVLPRYRSPQLFHGAEFPDFGWPGVPDLKTVPELDEITRRALHAALLDAFVQNS